MSNTKSRSTRRSSEGFTLIELMITVAIIAVLAVLAAVGFSAWIRHGKTAEVTSMISAIRGAEETWFNDHAQTQYLDISGNGTGGANPIPSWMPSSAPTDQKVVWDTTTAACSAVPCTNFKRLGVVADSYVYYRYGGTAGPAGQPPIAALKSGGTITAPIVTVPWYFIEAYGNLTNQTSASLYADYYTSTWNTTVSSVNADN
jgi:prepilin-type N-terminal cleavage/methylation domain-containing protein